MDVVQRCPSGALTHHRKDGGQDESHEETTISVGKDNAFYIKGNFILEDNGQKFKLNRAVLTNRNDTDNPRFYDKSLSKHQ